MRTPFSPVSLKSIDFVVRRRAKVDETLNLRLSGGLGSIFEAIPIYTVAKVDETVDLRLS